MTTASYSGPERRKLQRRQKADQREMVRFEPEKTPRRSGNDRRKGDIWKGRNGF